MVGFEWDEKEARAYLWREAVKEGEKKGEKRGEKKGEIRFIKQMLSSNFSISDIVRASGYSEEDILAIKNGTTAKKVKRREGV